MRATKLLTRDTSQLSPQLSLHSFRHSLKDLSEDFATESLEQVHDQTTGRGRSRHREGPGGLAGSRSPSPYALHVWKTCDKKAASPLCSPAGSPIVSPTGSRSTSPEAHNRSQHAGQGLYGLISRSDLDLANTKLAHHGDHEFYPLLHSASLSTDDLTLAPSSTTQTTTHPLTDPNVHDTEDVACVNLHHVWTYPKEKDHVQFPHIELKQLIVPSTVKHEQSPQDHRHHHHHRPHHSPPAEENQTQDSGYQPSQADLVMQANADIHTLKSRPIRSHYTRRNREPSLRTICVLKHHDKPSQQSNSPSQVPEEDEDEEH
ncbi:hypothetical protein BZG36_01738 [Bifiguratus adelaidae]|uniref:Uncharacterized protein n=1 Tax=Bifiguratus adelaidae TaxID=1938954 RepID=A0A261Y2W4_9FUNG|nr:hypothetical protein BZG36_01738 [Bifiguratus adelaidae]